MAAHSRWFYAVRTTAIIEAVKGTLVLTIGAGLASGLRRHAQRLLERWSAHLDPLAHLSHVLARLGGLLASIDPAIALAAASAYACARFAEAYGLWHARPWALWLGVLSGAIFVPFELLELLRRPGVMSVAILIANIAIVTILARALLGAASVSYDHAARAVPRPRSS